MLIPKPIRQILYCVIALFLCILCALLLSKWLGNLGIVLAFLLYPLFNVCGGIPIDSLDLWLRRKTRDPIWLISNEGREWLKSEEGELWQQQNSDRN